MSMLPWTRRDVNAADNAMQDAIEDDANSTFRVTWREAGTQQWHESIVIPMRTRRGTLQFRIIAGTDTGAIVDFPLRGIEYCKYEPAGQQRLVNAVSRQQEMMNTRAEQLDVDRRALSSQRRAVLEEQGADWEEINRQRHSAQEEVTLLRSKLREEEARLHDTRNRLSTEFEQATQARQREDHAIDQRRISVDEEFQKLHEELRAADDIKRGALETRERELMAVQHKVSQDARALRVERENLFSENEQKKSQDDATIAALTDRLARATASLDRTRALATQQQPLQALQVDYARIEGFIAKALAAHLLDAPKKSNKHKSRTRDDAIDLTEETDSSDEEHIGATDEESEVSCRTALAWWEKKENFLDFADRATSAFLADKLSNETFEEAWRRRLKLRPNSKEYLSPLIEDTLRRLRLTLRVVRLGAPNAVAAYAHRKCLRDALEAAGRLELTIAGASAKDFEKYNASLRKARARNRSRKNEFVGLDSVVAEVKAAVKPSTARSNTGGRRGGGQKTTTTPRPQSPKPAAQ